MRSFMFLLALCTIAATARAEEGIAQKYPGDRGIEGDPAVVFTEDFEKESVEAVRENWTSARFQQNFRLTEDVPPGSPGKTSLLIQGGEGGTLTKVLDRGYEKLHWRFYAKFTEGTKAPSHWCGMGGQYPPRESLAGRAGHRPDGDAKFNSQIEPTGGWEWYNYTYWCRMHPFPNGRYWGNTFQPVSKRPVARGKWICVEFMMKVNTPVSATNGEQAAWIDGEKILHQGPGFPKGYWEWGKFINDPNGEGFEGFQWRTIPELLVNTIGMMSWTPNDPTHGSWFDHVVVATEYIGPMKRE